MNIILYSLIVIATIATACSQPLLEPEKPALAPAAPPEVLLSTMNIEFKIPIGELADGIHKSLMVDYRKRPWHQLIDGGPDYPRCGVGVGYHFVTEKKSVAVTLSNDTISTKFILNYWLKARKRPICPGPLVYFSCGTNGEPRRKMGIALTTTIGIRKNWEFEVNTAQPTITPLNQCRLGPWGVYNATAIVQAQTEKTIHNFVSTLSNDLENKINLRDRMVNFWSALHQPQEIDQHYLFFNPTQIRIHPIKSDSSFMRLGFLITGEARLVNTKPVVHSPSPLPDATPGRTSDDFNILLPLEVPYPEVKKTIEKKLKQPDGNYLRFPETGESWCYVKDISIEGGYNEHTLIRLDIDGTAKGWLYLLGTPKFNPETKEIYFNDLEFSLGTRRILKEKGGWFMKEADKLLDHMNKRTRLNLARELTDQMTRITAFFNSRVSTTTSSIKLSGRLKTMDFQKLHFNEQSQVVTFYFHAKGKVSGKLL
jgi:hypothetical protein